MLTLRWNFKTIFVVNGNFRDTNTLYRNLISPIKRYRFTLPFKNIMHVSAARLVGEWWLSPGEGNPNGSKVRRFYILHLIHITMHTITHHNDSAHTERIVHFFRQHLFWQSFRELLSWPEEVSNAQIREEGRRFTSAPVCARCLCLHEQMGVCICWALRKCFCN